MDAHDDIIYGGKKAGEGTDSCASTDARQHILKYPLHLYCPMLPPLETYSGHLPSPAINSPDRQTTSSHHEDFDQMGRGI